MGYIDVCMVHTVAPQHIVRCASTLPGNGQFLMANCWFRGTGQVDRPPLNANDMAEII